MKNLFIHFFFLIMFFLQGQFVASQTTLLDQTMLTEASFNNFTVVSVSGTQTWYYSNIYGAICNGYTSGQSFENEDWLISPSINLTQTDNVKLTFNHTRGSAAVVNVGVAQGWYKVFATANYTGDPLTTQWIELGGFNQTLPSAWSYVSSGELIVPEVAKSENTRIAFRYMSSAMQSATWEIKNVKVVGEPQGSNPNAGLFKITNWNTEWLGCTTFGPTDEALQVNNVVSAMLSMNSDLYCIQEVTNSLAYPSIATIVSQMGNQEWEGKISPSTTDDCDQRQGIIYKKAKVQYVSAAQLSSGNAAQGNSYYYNWSSGRYPSLYNLNLIVGSNLVPLSIVNIHAKAEDGVSASYTRRLGASQALKTILDGANYNSKNLILIGDFNDYLIGTTSTTCNCTVSPYNNFTTDEANYTSITKDLVDVNTTFGTHPIIENIILSNELSGNYVGGSVVQEVGVASNISNYQYTTSNHLPVSAQLQFTSLSNQQYSQLGKPWSIYPNPVKTELKYDSTGFSNDTDVAIYDLTGRAMWCKKINAQTLNVADLPAGIYILKAANFVGRFIKE